MRRHPFREDRDFKKLIGERRGEAAKDDVFSFENSPLEPNDVDVSSNASGSALFSASGNLTDDEFESFKTQAKDEGFTFRGGKKAWEATDDDLDKFAPNPIDVHESRGQSTKRTDSQRRATITTDVETYATAPERYDYPGVDTPAEAEEKLIEESVPSPIFELNSRSDSELDDFL